MWSGDAAKGLQPLLGQIPGGSSGLSSMGSSVPCILLQVLSSPFTVMKVLAENFGYLVGSILILITDLARWITAP